MLTIREKQFDLKIEPGESARGVLHVEASGGKKVRGELYTDHVRIVTEFDRFSGNRVKLRFGVDAHGLAEGDIIRGALLLATDMGEFRIPVTACVTRGGPPVPDVRVKTLSGFAALAREDAETALRVYREPSFRSVIPAGDTGLRALLRGFSEPPVLKRNVEEFLVASGHKAAVRIHADFLKARFDSLTGSVEEEITLRRNTWGTFSLTASCPEDFIELPKKRVTDEDFVGMICRFPYRIIREKLGNGRRSARITLAGGLLRIDFVVTASALRKEEVPASQRRSELIIGLSDLCLDYVMRLTDGRRFADQADPIINELSQLPGGDDTALKLLRARTLMLRGRQEEADALLGEIGKAGFTGRQDDLKLAWKYLTSLKAGDGHSSDLGGRMRTLLGREPGNFLAVRLTFLTNPDIASSPRRKLRVLESAYAAGCRSPFLFAEIIPEIRKEDSYVASLTPFLVHTLLFAANGGHLTEGLALRAAYLSANEKTYSESLFRILTKAYETWPSDGILEAITRLLIKGRAADSQSFYWYEKALERDIRIIRLYEYYIETLPDSRRGVLPLAVRKYFAISDTLSENMKARVYANVVRNRQEDPETYGEYREKMEAFALRSMSEGRLNEDFAVLYQKFTGRIRSPGMARRLLDMIFTVRVYTDEPLFRKVIVIHDELRDEETAVLVRGAAYVRVYSDNARLLFEDASGRRCAGTAYRAERLIETEPFLTMCRNAGADSTGLLLRRCGETEAAGTESGETLGLWREVAGNDHFTDEYRASARKKILDYLLAHPEAVPDGIPAEDVLRDYIEAGKTELIRILITAGKYRTAYDLAVRYGFEGIDPGIMVRLASRMIDDNEGRYDEELALFAEHVFRLGKYDERILSYMTKHFRGSMEEMLLVRRKAAEFFIDTFPIDERILSRAVFTGTRVKEGPEILKAYSDRKGRGRVVRGYLTLVCDSIFGTEETISPFEAACIAEMMESGEMTDFTMKLAYLKFCAEKGNLSVREETLADRIVEECVKRNIRFRFFQKLPASLIAGCRLTDKVFVEQKAEPGDTVTLNYALTDGEDTENAVFRSEPMTRVMRGVFQRVFTLFYGEVLTYTVTVEHDGEETTGPERSVSSPFVDMTGSSAYQRINGIIRAVIEGDEDDARSRIVDLRRARHVAESVFTLEEETT